MLTNRRHRLITGGAGNWTGHLQARAEADIVAFARAVVPNARRVTFVTKPNSSRRVQLALSVR